MQHVRIRDMGGNCMAQRALEKRVASLEREFAEFKKRLLSAEGVDRCRL